MANRDNATMAATMRTLFRTLERAAHGRRELSDRRMIVRITDPLGEHTKTHLLVSSSAREEESDQERNVVQAPGRVSRLALGSVAAADGVAPVEAERAGELRVVKLRPPDRLSERGAGSASGVPPMIRTVCAAVSIPHTRDGTRRSVDPVRRAGHAIACGPHGQTEQCSEQHAAEHAAIVARRPVAVKRLAQNLAKLNRACDGRYATPIISHLAELSRRCAFSVCPSLM